MKKTKKLRKGEVIKLRNGKIARLLDAKKKQIREVNIVGTKQVIQVFTWDITHYRNELNQWKLIEHTSEELDHVER